MEPDINTVIRRARVAKTQPRRMLSSQVTIEDGDVVVTRELAGVWRSGPGLTAPTTRTFSAYRVSVRGQMDAAEQTFEMYDPAVADGDTLAADRKVRLFYTDDGAVTLLKDYRSGPRL